MKGSDLLSGTPMQAAYPAVRDRPWSARPWVAGVGIFVAVLTLDAVLKGWAQESLATPVCATSWMCLAVHHNPGLFLGMVPMAPDSTLSALHWLVVPPGPRVAGLARAHAGPRAVQCLLRTGRRRPGRQSRGPRRGRSGRLPRPRSGHRSNEKWAFINLADLALVAGVVWLGVLLVLRRKPARSSPGRASTHA